MMSSFPSSPSGSPLCRLSLPAIPLVMPSPVLTSPLNCILHEIKGRQRDRQEVEGRPAWEPPMIRKEEGGQRGRKGTGDPPPPFSFPKDRAGSRHHDDHHSEVIRGGIVGGDGRSPLVPFLGSHPPGTGEGTTWEPMRNRPMPRTKGGTKGVPPPPPDDTGGRGEGEGG